MRLEKIELKNFRCFSQVKFNFSTDIVIIYGNNGSGKTTIIEALHYLCYLSSFRSRLPSEIAQFESESFFIKGTVTQHDDEQIDIQVGFTKKQKVAKVGLKPISSYKELFPYYQIITVTIDDLELIQGSPIIRRSFVDQAILLANPEFLEPLQRCKKILLQRNALLQKPFNYESYVIWTKQLWEQTKIIQKMRIDVLNQLNNRVSQLLVNFFDPTYTLDIRYSYKHILPDESFEDFLERKKGLLAYESMIKRSDFGAHLDDFTLQFCSKKLKSFGSRGQQKLLVILLKIAQILDLQAAQNNPIFLLDDFITDFDKQRLQNILALLLTLKCQLIITSPIREKMLEELLPVANFSTIELKSL
jgi:DNA replication and repair protein RecF